MMQLHPNIFTLCILMAGALCESCFIFGMCLALQVRRQVAGKYHKSSNHMWHYDGGEVKSCLNHGEITGFEKGKVEQRKLTHTLRQFQSASHIFYYWWVVAEDQYTKPCVNESE